MQGWRGVWYNWQAVWKVGGSPLTLVLLAVGVAEWVQISETECQSQWRQICVGTWQFVWLCVTLLLMFSYACQHADISGPTPTRVWFGLDWVGWVGLGLDLSHLIPPRLFSLFSMLLCQPLLLPLPPGLFIFFIIFGTWHATLYLLARNNNIINGLFFSLQL